VELPTRGRKWRPDSALIFVCSYSHPTGGMEMPSRWHDVSQLVADFGAKILKNAIPEME